MARIVKAHDLTYIGVAGAGSAQVEELEFTFTTKDLNIDADAIVADTTIVKKISVHRASLVITKKIQTNFGEGSLTVSACGVNLFTISTSEYDWNTKLVYTLTQVNNHYDALIALLGT